MKDRRVEVEGIGIRYRTWGRESRPAVVFVHGLGGFLERWERNAEAFAEHFRVVALDLPGCGLSDKPRAPYTIPWYARMVRGFAGAAGLDLKAEVQGT